MSSSSPLLERMREGRSSPAVLKAKLSVIRSQRPGVAVFVFEGVDDVGVYEVWIDRCGMRSPFESLPGKGKEQVLAFREMLRSDTTGISRCVFFFVDADFDGLRGQSPGSDIFVQEDAYAIESWLISDGVLESLLCDEFRCAGDPGQRNGLVEKYRGLKEEFAAHIEPLMFRLYVARKFGIRVEYLEESVHKWVAVSLQGSTVVGTMPAETFVRLEREPTEGESNAAAPEFGRLPVTRRVRGKYGLQFFQKWVRHLFEDRRSGNPVYFREGIKALGNCEAGLTLRGLASRSTIPPGLCEFVHAASACRC